MKVFVVKIIDTNGVNSIDKIFSNRKDAELYVKEQEKNNKLWELQVFEYPVEVGFSVAQ
ncbi:MAG: hypothetical protein PWQ67_888 [Clostridia bacterium]|jgi:hypothetical protein|nr:hypothetical protein [Clostridia bacterium]MDN5322434.1 hypothetical protein [Clostridia bacterium]